MHDLCSNECSGMGQFDERHAGGRVSLIEHNYMEKRQLGTVKKGLSYPVRADLVRLA
jgi:hypothetical protein